MFWIMTKLMKGRRRQKFYQTQDTWTSINIKLVIKLKLRKNYAIQSKV